MNHQISCCLTKVSDENKKHTYGCNRRLSVVTEGCNMLLTSFNTITRTLNSSKGHVNDGRSSQCHV